MNMQFDFYKQAEGFDEEKTTLSDLLNIAVKYGMTREEAKKKLSDPDDCQIVFPRIRLWTEEAMVYRR